MKKLLIVIVLGCISLGLFLFYSTSNRVKIATFLKTQKENLFSREPQTATAAGEPAVERGEMMEEKSEIKISFEGPKFVEGRSEKEEDLIKYSCDGITFKTSISGLIPYKDTPMNYNVWYEKMGKSGCKIDESIFFTDSPGDAPIISGIVFHIVKKFPEIPGIEGHFPTLVVQNFLSDSAMFDAKDILFRDEQITILSASQIYIIKHDSFGMKTIFATVSYSREEIYGKEWSEKYTKKGCFDYGGPPDESQCPTMEEFEEKRILWQKNILLGDRKLQKAVQAIKSFTVIK